MNLRYYYGRESEQFTFFRIPKQLFSEPAFKTITADAKILYGLLLDRMSLSQKSGWLDSDNRVYIVFPIIEIQEQLGCCRGTAIKLLDELDAQKGGIGLIERVRRGLGQPSIIYVKNFNSEQDVSEEGQMLGDFSVSAESRTSRSSKNEHPEVSKNGLQEVQYFNIQKFKKRTSRSSKIRHY